MLFLSLSGCNIFNSVLGLRPHSCHELLKAALGFGRVAPIFFALSTDVLKYVLGGSSCMVKMRPKLPLHGTAKK